MKEVSEKRLAKAVRSIAAAERLLGHCDAEFAVSRAYYAMFYVAEALLHERNLQFSKHAAVHAAFGKQFAKTGDLDPKYHRWLIQAFNSRITGTMGSRPSSRPGTLR
jgi:uncharacterized protein (UPF0332 family)